MVKFNSFLIMERYMEQISLHGGFCIYLSIDALHKLVKGAHVHSLTVYL